MLITEFLRKLAPDFCYCTGFDLYLMYEQIYEDVDFSVFRGVLSKYQHLFHIKQGTRVDSYRYGDQFQQRTAGRRPKLYLRKSNTAKHVNKNAES